MRLPEPPDAPWRRALEANGVPPIEGGEPLEVFRASLRALCLRVLASAPLGRAVDAAIRDAAERLAAGLADRHGLRHFLSSFGDLPPDPVHAVLPEDRGREPSARDLAVYGWHALAAAPGRMPLEDALVATALHFGVAGHPLALGAGRPGAFCGDCAWNRRGHCLQVGPPWGGPTRIPKASPACARWEPRLADSDCAPCGACCREGFDLAPVRPGEAVLKAHPEWIEGSGRKAHLPRPGGRCVALDGDGSPDAPWRCRDYEARPRACSGLDVGGRGCLEARRRVGLSAG